MAKSLKESAVAFLNAVAAGQVREAYARYVGSGFKHHNPFFRGDAASLMEAMEQNAKKNPSKVLEVHTAIEEGNRVAVFSRVRQKPGDRGGAVVHLFRFEGERIVEFWDIGQAVPEESVNENGVF
jgi:predicted SnoaL-like aldol condensation-catalyzing enzyme